MSSSRPQPDSGPCPAPAGVFTRPAPGYRK